MALLDIQDLSLTIDETPILDRVSLTVRPGEIVGLVGESGSGKSMTALAVMGLLPLRARPSGHIWLKDEDLLAKSEAEMCRLRGRRIGMVFQEPMTALNPVRPIGVQVAEGFRWHLGLSRAEAWARAEHSLSRVGLPPDKVPLTRFPHELSGGQRQRVVIAMAMALHPELLIADEPTTALDVTVQAQILDLLRELVAENTMGLLLITHDLGVVAEMADRVAIMKSGRIVEEGDMLSLYRHSQHPYTRRLFEASTHVPDVRFPATRKAPSQSEESPLLALHSVVRTYPRPRRSLFRPAPPFRAVDGVSFTIAAGQSVGLVGESGCGKSTLARTILGLEAPQAGSVHLLGQDLYALPPQARRDMHRHAQVVFQDPYGSFNPRHKVLRLVAEPLHLLGLSEKDAETRDRVVAALEDVGLSAADAEKYPHEFSGGQRQRIAIARALITQPRLIVADEPVSALDVSIRAQILDLLAELRARHGLSYLFISHDLSVVRAITDEVLVMYQGRIVERGPTKEVFDSPQDPYTARLVAAAPDLHRALAKMAATEKGS